MTVTLKDIAEALDLSITTVSRALAGYSDVAAGTRERVCQMAEHMGYYPNITARQLQKQRTDTLAFVIPTHGPRFSDPFFSELLAGIGNEAGRHYYDLLVSTQAPDTKAEREAYQHIVNGKRADGALVVRTRQNDERIRFLSARAFPFVAFGRSDLDIEFPYVDEDSYQGIKSLTQHMIDLGHRRIALISAPPDLMFSRFRTKGYIEALQENGFTVDDNLIVSGDLTQRGGYHAAQKLMALKNRATAIVACNDLMALGTMSAIQNEGMIVGKDLSVGGFDDIASAEHAHPPLTTIRQPLYEIGQRITRMLVQILQVEEPEEREVILTPELMVRSSSGPPPG